MNRHVGASFTLSILIVGFFAVALYQPDSPPAPSPGPGPSAAPPTAPETLPGTVATTPEPTPSEMPRPEPSAAIAPRAVSAPLAPAPAAVKVQTASRRAGPPPPRSAFTEARDGEALADVALRVYGSADAARTLWMANRDLIETRDAPLRAGMLLRTP